MQTDPSNSPPFTLSPVFALDFDRDLADPDPSADANDPRAQFASGKASGETDSQTDEPGEGTGGDLDRPLTPERRLLCMIVRQLTLELLQAVGIETDSGGRRRATSHVRQVSIYVCHVAYSMPIGEVAQAFGLDRSTVRHACHMVEDRRDDAAYDRFVTIVERMASAVHLLAGRRL